MYSDSDVFNFCQSLLQDDWRHQTLAEYPEAETISNYEYPTPCRYPYHEQLYDPSDFYNEPKYSEPCIGRIRHPQASEHFNYFQEPVHRYQQRVQSERPAKPCRCGVDEHWGKKYPGNVDICRASCCRPGSRQIGTGIFPRGSCKSPHCPRVRTQCFSDFAGFRHTPCYPRLPEVTQKTQQSPKLPKLLPQIGLFPSREDASGGRGGSGGGARGRGSGGGNGNRGGGKAGGKKGTGAGSEKVLKVTNYEKNGTGAGFGGTGGYGPGAQGGPGPGSAGYGGGGTGGYGPGGQWGPGPGTAGYGGGGIGGYGPGAQGGRGPGGYGAGGYGAAGYGGYAGNFGPGKQVPCPGPRQVCPGPGACGGPRKAFQQSNKFACGRTSAGIKKTCPATKQGQGTCAKTSKGGATQSTPAKTCPATKK